jgi:hypothetical protein
VVLEREKGGWARKSSYSSLDHPMYDPLYVGACESGGIEVTLAVSRGLSQMQPLDPVTPLINTHNRPSASHVIDCLLTN